MPSAQQDSLADRLGDFGTGLRRRDVPGEVLDAAKLHLLDMLGCALAAASTEETAAAATVVGADGGSRQASAIGQTFQLPAGSAAFLNGVAAHALDYDDTHEQSICHVTTVVGPAAIASAEANDTTCEDLLVAFVAGAEVVCRIGMAASGGFHERGFHPTAVCGVFGATIAAARLFGLDDERTRSALGLAGSFSSGLFAYVADGTPTKPFHAGWAAQAGIQAARLSAAGAQGPSTVLEDRFGLFAAFADRPPDVDELLGGLGTRWELSALAYKAYPACHFLHTSVDAAVHAFESRSARTVDDIQRIDVTIPDTGVGLVLEPAAHKPRPRTPYDAKFSLPYSVAHRLIHGRLDLTSYSTSAIEDERVSQLAERVGYSVWPHAEVAPFAGEVTLTFVDGSTAAHRVDWPHGSPRNPMTPEQVIAKYHANAALGSESAASEQLLQAVLSLDSAAPVCDRFGPLALAGRGNRYG